MKYKVNDSFYSADVHLETAFPEGTIFLDSTYKKPHTLAGKSDPSIFKEGDYRTDTYTVLYIPEVQTETEAEKLAVELWNVSLGWVSLGHKETFSEFSSDAGEHYKRIAEHVLSLIPSAESLPATFIDGDDDTWYLRPNNKYRLWDDVGDGTDTLAEVIGAHGQQSA